MPALPYPMQLLNVEPQSCYLEDIYTVRTYDNNYLLSIYFHTFVAFYFWQVTENRNVMEQALRDTFRERTFHHGERKYIVVIHC